VQLGKGDEERDLGEDRFLADNQRRRFAVLTRGRRRRRVPPQETVVWRA